MCIITGFKTGFGKNVSCKATIVGCKSLLPPNSDHVTIYLGDYNCSICHWQLSARGYVRTEQLLSFPKWIITWSEMGGNRQVNTLAEYVYCELRAASCELQVSIINPAYFLACSERARWNKFCAVIGYPSWQMEFMILPARDYPPYPARKISPKAIILI